MTKIENIKNKKLLYFFPSTDYYIDSWQYIHFIDELKRNNINIEVFNPLIYSKDEFKEKLLKKIKYNLSDYFGFITADNGEFLNLDILKELQRIDLPKILICWDNLSIPFYHKDIAPYFDLVWITSKETEYLFKKWNANTIFMPYAANPNFFYPRWDNEIKKIGFIGTLYGVRKKLLVSLANNNIKVETYGSNKLPKFSKQNEIKNISSRIRKTINFMRFDIGRKCLIGKIINLYNNFLYHNNLINDSKNISFNNEVTFEDMAKLYSNFALTLNITELLDTFNLRSPVHKIHLRTFEIPMSGGLQITHFNNELSGYFEENNEIIFYNSNQELADKIKFYLSPKNDQLRFDIKRRAWERAKKEHTWKHRFDKLFNNLFS